VFLSFKHRKIDLCTKDHEKLTAGASLKTRSFQCSLVAQEALKLSLSAGIKSGRTGKISAGMGKEIPSTNTEDWRFEVVYEVTGEKSYF